jgi:hypothetical protein
LRGRAISGFVVGSNDWIGGVHPFSMVDFWLVRHEMGVLGDFDHGFHVPAYCRNQKMRLNRQARQERQDRMQHLLFLAFLASLPVQSFPGRFRATGIKSVYGAN